MQTTWSCQSWCDDTRDGEGRTFRVRNLRDEACRARFRPRTNLDAMRSARIGAFDDDRTSYVASHVRVEAPVLLRS